MKKNNLLSIVLLSVFVMTNSINRITTVEDIIVRVIGTGGKIEVTKKSTDDNSLKKQLTINLKEIREVTKEGDTIGPKDGNPHKIDDFSATEFEFSELKTGKFQGVKCKYFTYIAKNFIDGKGELKGYIYIFSESGDIKTGESQSITVDQGAVKFAFEIKNWPFCQPKNVCQEANCCRKGAKYLVGSYIEMDLEMKTDTNDEPNLENTEEIDFGDYTQVILTNEVKIDDKWKNMPEGYPKQSKTNKNVFTMRFPKFKKSVLLDPVIDLHGDVTYSVTQKNIASSLSLSLIFMFFTIILLVF